MPNNTHLIKHQHQHIKQFFKVPTLPFENASNLLDAGVRVSCIYVYYEILLKRDSKLLRDSLNHNSILL